jgi:hypothetical protein
MKMKTTTMMGSTKRRTKKRKGSKAWENQRSMMPLSLP